MSTERPVNLDLTKFRFPITAIISILHRVTGVVLFLGVPFLIYLLMQSLSSQASFAGALAGGPTRFFLWVVLSSLAFHLIAGCRHVIMDFGFGESFKVASFTSLIVLGLTAITVIFIGVWLW